LGRARAGRTARLLAGVAAALTVTLGAVIWLEGHGFRSTVPTGPGVGIPPPLPRSGASLVYDQARHELVLFGGDVSTEGPGTVSTPDRDTLTWNAGRWTLRRTASSPPARRDAVMAYDARRRKVVLYGGIGLAASPVTGTQDQLDDTWTWDGSSWTQARPKHSPGFNFSWPATAAYDPASKAVLLYGFTQTTTQTGSGSGSSMNAETWSWDGSDWTRLSPTTSPSQEGVMVATADRTYLVAGASGRLGGLFVSQMWEWEGKTWTLLAPANDWRGLSGALAFDLQHHQIVAFTGDTWTWDGSGWMRHHRQARPSDIGYMAYFGPLGEVVLWGSGIAANNAMWAWDGSNWNLIQPGTFQAPSPAGLQRASVTPGEADAFVRQNLTNTSPVLLPSWLPASMEASVTLTPDFFTVEYASDQLDKTVSISSDQANPPPGDAQSFSSQVPFRNSAPMKFGRSGYADYFVYDSTSPTSARWLMWLEPGRMANPEAGPDVVPYFLSASGLTDQEFWQVADSLN